MAEATAPRIAETALVSLAMGGNDEAFRRLVLGRQKWLLDLMHRLCGDAAEAEDLTQQAFVRAWRMLPTLKAPGAFGGWLRRLAVNVWLQEARRVRPARGGLDDLPEAGHEPDPGLRLDLVSALGALSPPERMCIVLCYGEGMSHAEIADAHGLPLGTIKSHILRGAERLRRSLGSPDDR